MLASAVLLVSVLVGVNARDFSKDTCNGSTPIHFRRDFLRHCRNRDYVEATCNSAWTKFSGAFVNRDPLQVKPEDYADYFKIIPMNVERNKVLFWSDTRELANVVAMMTDIIVTSHDIKAAQILNEFGLEACWCSNKGNNGLDTTSASCPPNTTNFLWAQFSYELARVSEGIVFFLADGQAAKPYHRDSYFTCYELIGLEKDHITRLVVLNIHEWNKGESCGNGTFVDLQHDVKKKRIPYECFDINGTVADAENSGSTFYALTSKIIEVQASKAVKMKEGIMLATICSLLAAVIMI